MTQIVRPSHADPLVAAASESIGGPVGEHARPHWWWTPVRVVLAVAALAFVLGMVQKTPCVRDDWAGTDLRYGAMCYSDVPYLYSGRGFAAGYAPYEDTGGRYPALEYPVVIGYFAYVAAVVTQDLGDPTAVRARADLQESQIYGQPGVPQESGPLLQGDRRAAGAVRAAGRLVPRRGAPPAALGRDAVRGVPGPGAGRADQLGPDRGRGARRRPVAWSRGRPLLTGVMIGIGTATKLYPLFLLGALLVVCLRRGRMRAFTTTAGRQRGHLAAGERAGDALRLRPVEGVLVVQQQARRRPRLAVAGGASRRATPSRRA